MTRRCILTRVGTIIAANIPVLNLLLMYYIIFTEPKTKEAYECRIIFKTQTAISVILFFFTITVICLHFVFKYLVL